MADLPRAKRPNRYERIIEKVFFAHFSPGQEEVEFDREEVESVCRELRIPAPKNLGDVVYSFRYRIELPKSITKTAPEGKVWVIKAAGRGRYRFVAARPVDTRPRAGFKAIKVPEATPGLISMYALTDEQALLAKIRYNRLVDIFTGVTCYSLQSHLRTTVPGMGQVETDEVYVGIDKHGAQYVFPVEAKGARENLGSLQIGQDVALCQARFSALICRPIGAQFTASGVIAMFEFALAEDEIEVVNEKHYRLVPPDELSAEDLRAYATQSD